MAKFADLFRAVGQDDELPVQSRESTEKPAEDNGFTLLFVDDEDGVLRALARIFFDENYRILTAANASEALDILNTESIHLIISDHRMPGMTGAQLLREVKEKWPDTIRIMLTGYADVQSIMGAVNEGAVYKFITKPWNDEDLRLTVSLALQQYVLLQENKKLREITRTQQVKIKNYSNLIGQNGVVLSSILDKAGLVSKADFHQAVKERREEEFIIDTLDRLGLASEAKVIKALQQQLNLEFLDLREMNLHGEVVRFLPQDLCRKERLLPIKLDGRQITLAMADPSDFYKTDNIGTMTGLRVNTVIARGGDILAQLNRIYKAGETGANSIADDLDDISVLEPMDEVDIILEEENDSLTVQELVNSAEIPPIIRIVNAIISEAVRYRASDIHIEPKTKSSVVRFRIDGILHDKIRIPNELHGATVSRIKILAKLDISERRQPQDGRITVKAGTRMVDLRVSTMPSINGEKVVLRILDKSASVKSLDQLGLGGMIYEQMGELIRKPQGIIIATGPTGSGKTTLLYSILSAMMQRSRNFETIEDPVEYFLEDANQIHVHQKVGLSFASVLRATLRQDPDVILVGEVRDTETADVTFKAALTGHMVLTTLHTNNSVASITRLVDLGVKPYLIASALEGVVAQRLVRRVCDHCRVEEPANPDLLRLLRLPADYFPNAISRGRGCPRCNQTGYLGRTGIFELFMMNDDFRQLISENYRESKLLQLARSNGMMTLLENGLTKVAGGETTLDELLRVIGPQIRHERDCDCCGQTIDAKYLFCPFCGCGKQNICHACRMPLEDGWKLCPHCGQTRETAPTPGQGGHNA